MKSYLKELIEYMRRDLKSTQEKLCQYQNARPFEWVTDNYAPTNQMFGLPIYPFEHGKRFLVDGDLYEIVSFNRERNEAVIKIVSI